MAHVPPNQALAPSAATASAALHTLTESEQNELRAHGLEPHHVRIADGAHVKGEQRDAVVSLLADAWAADVRHLLRWNKTGLVSRAGTFLDQIQPPSGPAKANQEPWGHCIVVEVGAGLVQKPVAIEVVEYNAVDRALRIPKAIEDYKQKVAIHPGGFGEVERLKEGAAEQAARFRAIRFGGQEFFEQCDLDVLFEHENWHAARIRDAPDRHHLLIDLLPSPHIAPPGSQEATFRRIGHYRILFAAWKEVHAHPKGAENCDVHVFHRAQHCDVFPNEKPVERPGLKVVRAQVHPVPLGEYHVPDYTVDKTTYNAPAVAYTTLNYPQLTNILAQRGYVHQTSSGFWEPSVLLFDPIAATDRTNHAGASD